jgi:DNA-binding response OmpR family regulator
MTQGFIEQITIELCAFNLAPISPNLTASSQSCKKANLLTTTLPMRAHILVAEDQTDIRDLLLMNLRSAGYEATGVVDGEQALVRQLDAPCDLLILDLMMPRMDGLEVCKALRARGSATPILMLTAKSTELDRVLGLELGADDYLTKPFSLAELLARVKALLRRATLLAAAQASAQAGAQTAGLKPATVIRNGELEILPAKRQVRCRGAALDFTALEFDLLLHFASHPGHVFSRAQLLNEVWGYSHDGYEHTVTTHINRLRAKLEADPMRPEFILTARGAGYKMRDLE